MYKIINSSCGPIKGVNDNGILCFKGIRYATAKRWAYPELITKFDEEYNALEYGHCCYQNKAFNDESGRFYFKEFNEGVKYSFSEDCLFLNIFCKDNLTEDSNLPVIVYIHGGSFINGSSNELEFDYPSWPKEDVIAVTINYRIGLLGFGCFKEAEEESGHTGNYGLADQIAAITWVKNNIKAFGGDPNNITIMGQSAGAMSVQALVYSPKTEGLISKAVMVSGGGNNILMKLAPSSKKFDKFAKLYEATGCKTFEELRNFDVDELHKIYYKIQKEEKLGLITIPYVDGEILVENQYEAIKRGHLKNIPYMIGTTSEDMMSGILYDMASKWCLLQEKHNLQPSYLWMFDRYLPGDDSGSWHAADLWYWFGTFNKCWRPFEEKDHMLKDTMIKYLTNFARNGNPNDDTLPKWEPHTKKNKKAIFFGEGDVRMDKVKRGKLYKFMLTKKPVGF